MTVDKEYIKRDLENILATQATILNCTLQSDDDNKKMIKSVIDNLMYLHHNYKLKQK